MKVFLSQTLESKILPKISHKKESCTVFILKIYATDITKTIAITTLQAPDLIKRSGSPEIRKEGILKQTEEEVLIIHAIDTLKEEDNALLVGRDEARGDVTASFLSCRVGQGEPQGQHTLTTNISH